MAMVPLRSDVRLQTSFKRFSFLDSVIQGTPSKSTKARKAVFSIREQSADIYLVLKVEKVLTGDQDAATEPYFKHATVPKLVLLFKYHWPNSGTCFIR